MSEREKYLARIPGAAQALEVMRSKATGAKRALDTVGVAHKAVVEDMMTALDEALATITEDETMRGKIREAVLSVLTMAPEEEIAEEVPMDDMIDEELMGIGLDDNMKSLAVKQASIISELVTTQADIAGSLEVMAANVTEIPDLKEALKALTGRISAMEAKLRLQPRAASQSPTTIVEDSEIEKAARKSTARRDPFWGTELSGEK
jgi:hypothetical protein